MESVPIFIVITVLLGLVLRFSSFVLQLFGWLKIEPDDVKKFIVLRGRTLAWNVYLILAILITIYFGIVLSIVISFAPFSIGVATLIILVLWVLLSVWAPAIQRLHNKRINAAVNIIAICLLTLAVIGFWIAQWPEWQQPTIVTLLLVLTLVIYLVDRFIIKRKRHVLDGD